MKNKLLLTTAITLGSATVVASEASVLSVFVKENLTKDNTSEDQGSEILKVSHGADVTLQIKKSLSNPNDQWIETWGHTGVDFQYTGGVQLGREYYTTTYNPHEGDPPERRYSWEPGEVVFTDATGNALTRGNYTVTDAYMFSGGNSMAIIRFPDDGAGNYKADGNVVDHIYVWGKNVGYGLMGAGKGNADHKTPYLVKSTDKPNTKFGTENIVDILESGEYHVKEIMPANGNGSAFMLIDNSTINTDGTSNDDAKVERMFSWGLNNSSQALNSTTIASTSGGISFPEECNMLLDADGTPLLDKYKFVDFTSGTSGGGMELIPKGIDVNEHPEEARVWVWGQKYTFVRTTETNFTVFTSGFLDDGDAHDHSGLIKEGDYDTGDGDFYSIINDDATYPTAFDINGNQLVAAIYDGTTGKNKIFYTGYQTSGLGFEPATTTNHNSATNTDLTYWKDISSNFQPLADDSENNYVKSLSVSINSSASNYGSNGGYGNTTAAAVITNKTTGNDSLYMWGYSQGSVNGTHPYYLMGDNKTHTSYGDRVGDVDDGSEKAINTTPFFPNYNENAEDNSFQINYVGLSTVFVSAYVTENGQDKLYQWGSNTFGELGIGNPNNTVGEASVPFILDRAPQISIETFNSTKNSVEIKYKIKKYNGINLWNSSADDFGNQDSIFLSGTGIKGGSQSLINDETPIRNGETDWMSVDLSSDVLDQGQTFDDWKVEMTYKDTFSSSPDNVVKKTFDVPSFSTTKDLTLKDESIQEKTADSDIVDNIPVYKTEDIKAGEKYLDINATVDNSFFTPITEELINDTIVKADLTSDRHGAAPTSNQQLNIVQINTPEDSYVSHDYTTGLNDDGTLATTSKDIINDKTPIEFIIQLPEEMQYNAEISNFEFGLADGYNGVDPETGAIDTSAEGFYTSFKSSKLDIKTSNETARIDSIGTDNGDNTFTFTPNEGTITKNSFAFDANIYNPDDLANIEIQMTASEIDNNNLSIPAKDVTIDTQLVTTEFPDGFSHENGLTTYKAVGLDSCSTYDIKTVSITSNGETKTLNIKDTSITTVFVNPTITNAEWSHFVPNTASELASPYINFDFENSDKTDIQNIVLSQTIDGKQVEIPLTSDDYEIASYTEEGQDTIVTPSLSDITYTDGSVGATHAYKTGHYSIEFKNLLPLQRFTGIKVTFDSNYKSNSGSDITKSNTYSIPDLMISEIPPVAVIGSFNLKSVTSTGGVFAFDVYNPDSFDLNSAVITINDGTKDITKEFANEDFVLVTPTRDLSDLKTYELTVDGLESSTSYTITSFIFNDAQALLPGQTISFETAAPEVPDVPDDSSFPWKIIVLVLLIITGLILLILIIRAIVKREKKPKVKKPKTKK